MQMFGKADFHHKFLSEIGGQLLDHGFVLLGLVLHLKLPGKLKVAADLDPEFLLHLLDMHEVVEVEYFVLVRLQRFEVGGKNLDDYIAYVRSQDHEQGHCDAHVELRRHMSTA